MIITSFMRVVYPLKYPSNACLSCLDNGPCCWNVFYLECQNVSKCHGCLTIVSSYIYVGVLPKQNTQIPLKYQNIINMPLSN